MSKKITLRPGKDKAVRQGHPWIFSGAIASGLEVSNGDLAQVFSASGDLLGSGYFNTKGSIAGRMLTFDARDPIEALIENIRNAIWLRSALIQSDTTGYRLINGEGDFIPGLIVDKYDQTLVLQVSTKGMANLRDVVVKTLQEELHPKSIYEKSVMPSRADEGLSPSEQWLFGEPTPRVPFIENGLHFIANVVEGQKTGFFLDQRDMRGLVRERAKDRRVLNCFCYSGAFSVAAMAGGAKSVTSVDISQNAVDLAREHVALNNLDADQHEFIVADVFDYLRKSDMNYDLVILDPPAFSKKRHDVVQACRGYKDINRVAMKGMPRRSLLLTSSCSHFVDDLLFQKVVFQAAVEAGRNVRILDRHHYTVDHPENVCHPEGHYLKSLLLYVD
ncbi:MAG: class I SAM-dependent rRNA methyltransferase [Chlamydiales bacterium]|nr:class I SAM-dependent rRNA methyltransferase [Chlamydiales bacterium]